MAEAGTGTGDREGRPYGDSAPGLESDLEKIVVRGRHRLRFWAAKEALQRAFGRAFAAALVVPVLALAGNAAGLLGTPLWPLGIASTLTLAVTAPVAIIAIHALAIFLRERTDRRTCLALYDQVLGFKDRLQTADQFLSSGHADAFELAAIEDATPFAQRALDTELPAVRTAPPELRPGRWPLGATALALLVAALLLDGLQAGFGIAGPTLPDEPPLELAALVETTAEEDAEPPPPKDTSRRSLDEQRLASLTRPGLETEPERAQQSAAGTGDARTSSASDSAAASLARQAGQAAAGASAAGAPRRNEPRQQTAKPRRENTSQPEKAKQEQPESAEGLSGGSGRSSGSRTSSSDQPAADNKARNDEAEGDATDDAEDEEDEEQKSASTQRPMLNNRKAPVDRSLSPSGLSDQENPDANGRGGPGGLKKTRGVAAMLLGVPMPDHLRGKSNPGRIKVQRERADPEPKTASPDVAANRGSRDESIGYLPHPALAAWMQDTIRRYFLTERRADTAQESGDT